MGEPKTCLSYKHIKNKTILFTCVQFVQLFGIWILHLGTNHWLWPDFLCFRKCLDAMYTNIMRQSDELVFHFDDITERLPILTRTLFGDLSCKAARSHKCKLVWSALCKSQDLSEKLHTIIGAPTLTHTAIGLVCEHS